jgi:curved DNA-binding protein
MPAQRDYYEILGVARGATEDEIKAAYRKLARQLHPDVSKAPDAAEKFREATEAYDVLSDPDQRKKYDRFGHAGPGMGGGAHAGGTAGGRQWSHIDPEHMDLGSIFEEMFGGGARRGGSPFGGFGGMGGGGVGNRARAQSQPARGRDLVREVDVDFMTAALGGSVSLRVRRGGAMQSIDVKIPKGADNGQKLRVRGAGAPSAGGGPPGDLILTVKVQPHPLFQRDGLDVTLELPLTIAEAALGATVTVPTLSGKKATLTIPPGTSSGSKLRLRGQGLSETSVKAGDLIVIAKVMAPKSLSENDRKMLEELAPRLEPVREGSRWP